MFESNIADTVPAQSELYYWADYVELLCLTDVDGQFSAERLAQVTNFADDFMATAPEAQDIAEVDVAELLLDHGSDSLGDPDDFEIHGLSNEVDLDDTGGGEEPEPQYADFGREVEKTDNRRAWAGSIWQLLIDRQDSLGERYPFDVDPRFLRIERRETDEAHHAYVFYLSCSSLSYVGRATLSALTAQFEMVSFAVLTALVGSAFEVDMYGTAKGLGKSRFVGSQYARLELLASELHGTVKADPLDFHPKDSGDSGLDLVAWLPMDDRAKGTAAIFAQCACGKKWDGKQYEASYERWRELIDLKSPSTKMTFVPHYFRKPGGYWYSDSDVSGVLVDRLRAIQYAHDEISKAVPSELVQSALSYRLGVV